MILVFGSLSMGAMAGAIGRKKTIMVFCLPLLVGWIIVGISGGNVLLLCLGRICQGIGTMSSVTQVYLVEVADAQRRQFSCFFFINKISISQIAFLILMNKKYLHINTNLKTVIEKRFGVK